MPWATLPAEFRVSDTPPYVGAREALDYVRAKALRDEQRRGGDSLRAESLRLVAEVRGEGAAVPANHGGPSAGRPHTHKGIAGPFNLCAQCSRSGPCRD